MICCIPPHSMCYHTIEKKKSQGNHNRLTEYRMKKKLLHNSVYCLAISSACSQKAFCQFIKCSYFIQLHFRFVLYNNSKVERPCFKSPNPPMFCWFQFLLQLCGIGHIVFFFFMGIFMLPITGGTIIITIYNLLRCTYFRKTCTVRLSPVLQNL